MLTPPSRFVVSVHRGAAGHRALRERWDALAADVGARFFCTWGWYDAFLAALEPDPERVLFACLEDGGALVAIVPLREERVVRRGVPIRQLGLPRHDHLPLAGVPCRDALSLDELLDALAAGLRAAGVPWDALVLSHVLAEGLFAQPPARWGWRTQLGHVKTCDEVACDAWDAFAARLSANFRSNLNKAKNKLAKERDVRFGVAESAAAMAELFPHFAALEAAGWKGKAGTAIAQDARLEAFYRRLIDDFAPTGAVCMPYLWLGDRLIAAQLSFVDNETLYVDKLTYDETQSKLAPGNLLLKHVIAAGTWKRVNLVGSPDWFQQWSPTKTDVIRVTAFNATARGALLLAEARAKAIAKPLYQRLRAVRTG